MSPCALAAPRRHNWLRWLITPERCFKTATLADSELTQGEVAGGRPATGLIEAVAVAVAADLGSTAKCTFGKGYLSLSPLADAVPALSGLLLALSCAGAR